MNFDDRQQNLSDRHHQRSHYVLDATFDNETGLTIQEHTTDTAGYTDLVFALFDLNGLRFSPRIRDLADQRLWRLPTTPTEISTVALLRHRVNPTVRNRPGMIEGIGGL